MSVPAAEGRAAPWLATFRKEGTERFEVSSDPGSSHTTAREGDVTVLFDGLLHSRRGWLRDFSLPTASDASLVLEAYLRWGEGLLEQIKGLFALVVWDSSKNLLLCARDPHGMHPLFYAENAGDLLLSASAEALARHPRIPGTIDRVAIANHLCYRWPTLEATYFEHVRRLPGGYALRVHAGGHTVRRYWDPEAPGSPSGYLSEEEAGRFTELLEQAVDRCLPQGRPAIYLSGGLDSVSVAALAQERLRDRDTEPLLALSLVFEHPAANEEDTQRRIATRLGLPLKIVTISEAVGPEGLLASAYKMSASRPAPMVNLWNPAYAFLGRYAADQGCEAILTGNGGDEWLEAGVHHGRTALRQLDFVNLYRIWSSMQRSQPLSGAVVARNLLWTFGLRPILRQAAATTLEHTAPGVLARQEQWRFDQTMPAWVDPDPWVREQMLEGFRAHKRRRSRSVLDNPIVAVELEEFHESGRRLGVPLLHPYWDADLTVFAGRLPPRLLIRDGYSKGLLRQPLARRFPELGFDRHKKVTASGFYRSVMLKEGIDLWKEVGGAQALGELGVVDPVALDRYITALLGHDGAGFSETNPGHAYLLWYVLSLEAWVRSHTGL